MAIEAELARDETVDGAGSKMQREDEVTRHATGRRERVQQEIERIEDERVRLARAIGNTKYELQAAQ